MQVMKIVTDIFKVKSKQGYKHNTQEIHNFETGACNVASKFLIPHVTVKIRGRGNCT